MTDPIPPTVLAVRQKELADLLGRYPDWNVTKIITEMDISRGWFYQIRDRLVDLGVLFPITTVSTDESTRTLAYPMDSSTSPERAPVRHTWWDDVEGQWAVQGLMLDRWDRRPWPQHLPNSRVVVARFVPSDDQRKTGEWAWTAPRRQRWTLDQTQRRFLPGQLTRAQLERLTKEVAWALSVDAVIPPEQ
jgi:hypothetical protein